MTHSKAHIQYDLRKFSMTSTVHVHGHEFIYQTLRVDKLRVKKHCCIVIWCRK